MHTSSDLFLALSSRFLRDEFLPRIRVAVERLDDQQMWWRPNDASNSIGNLILHLCGNVMQWIVGGVGGQAVTRDRQREFDERSLIPRTELLARLAAVVDSACAVLDGLDPAVLHERRTIQGMEVTVMYAIYHVVEHFSMHTGQILMLTKMITAEDLKLYEFPGGAAVRRW
jgi:uncharacterized damage-inducible protein DinB